MAYKVAITIFTSTYIHASPTEPTVLISIISLPFKDNLKYRSHCMFSLIDSKFPRPIPLGFFFFPLLFSLIFSNQNPVPSSLVLVPNSSLPRENKRKSHPPNFPESKTRLLESPPHVPQTATSHLPPKCFFPRFAL